MIINVDKLRDELVKYNTFINKYEDIFLKLYGELNSASVYWNDGRSISFFEHVDKEKDKIKNVISELNGIFDFYSYIVENYEKIGNKIRFDLSVKDSIIDKYNIYINKVEEIIRCYNNLDLSFCPQEASLINDEKNKFLTIRDVVINSKNNVEKIFFEIERIEKEIGLMVSRINIDFIKETDISLFF